MGLRCHSDARVCRVCIGWLRGQAGGLDVTPTLPVWDLDEAVNFYEALGFEFRDPSNNNIRIGCVVGDGA